MRVNASIEIDRPADVVFGYVADMAKNPTWQSGQQQCTWTSEPPIRVGSTYDQIARFAGRTISSSFEVTEFDPPRTIRIVSTAGTMPIDVTRTVEALGENRARVSADVAGDPPAAMKLLGPLLKRMVGSNVRKDYERLKELLEAPSPTP
ncbi:MAG: SRPBCC family protein [Actinomycetota bacterium]